MAIQSFSVGQVLTAAQVNALQANDYNQTVSNKTASYTLVAADKGTRITMSSTSATTITVNTSLFSAGDTLFIQNLNTGVSTITAGTATVTTSSSLALAQWEGGTLYFTSASAAIFFKSDGAAASSGGMTLLSTTSLSGSSVSLTSISQDYTNLLIVGSVINSNDVSIKMQYNSDTTAGNYSSYYHLGYADDTRYLQSNLSGGNIFDTLSSTTGTTKNYCIINIYRYSSAENHQAYSSARSTFPSVTFRSYNVHHAHSGTDAITSIQLIASGGTLSGTIYLYGVK